MPTEVPVQTVTVPGPRRMLVGLIWGLIQAVIVFTLLFAGGGAAAFLDQAVTGQTQASPAAVLAGLAAGLAAGLFAGHKARTWLQEARLAGSAPWASASGPPWTGSTGSARYRAEDPA